MNSAVANFLQVLDTICDYPDWMTTKLHPSAKVDKDTLVLSWDMPGAKREVIEMETENNILVVRGIGGRYRNQSSQVRVNKEYDLQTSDATLKDGVLTVAISKGKHANTNKIEIKTS